jgi:hypothetical protein
MPIHTLEEFFDLKTKILFTFLASLIVFAIYFISLESDPVSIEESRSDAIETPNKSVNPDESWMYEFIKPSASITPASIYAFECELRTKKPKALTTVCADFGQAVWEIKWNKWDAFGGQGFGIYRENDCNPSCAEGTITSRAADVLLSSLTFDGTRYYFNTANVRFKGEKYRQGQYEFVWDIASFYREVPEMRSEKIYED